MVQTDKYMRGLVVFYYISAIWVLVVGLIPIVHFFVGVDESGGWTGGEHLWGGLLKSMVHLAMVVNWASSFCLFLAARYLIKRRNHTYCVTVAVFLCLASQQGMLLGIFTLILLFDQEVKASFAES